MYTKIKQWIHEYQKSTAIKKSLATNDKPRLYKAWELTDWGNALYMDSHFKCQGHLMIHPSIGDLLVAKMDNGTFYQYTFSFVKYCRDPRDMFFAQICPMTPITEAEIVALSEKVALNQPAYSFII
jgi:hypothetical protein